jgi:hypothetical protein
VGDNKRSCGRSYITLLVVFTGTQDVVLQILQHNRKSKHRDTEKETSFC